MTSEPNTVTFGVCGRLYAFGLSWTTPPATDDVKAAAQAAVRADGAKFVCFRKARRQFGVARVTANERPSLLRPWHSAAAALADGTTGAWLGYWLLQDGRVYGIAAGQKGILPDGDRMFGDEASARANLAMRQEQTHWRKVICPADWKVTGSAYEPLEALLAKQPGPTLQAVSSTITGPMVLRLVGVALFGLPTAVGLLYWRGHLTPAPLIEAGPAQPQSAPTPARYTAADALLPPCIAEITGPARRRIIPGWTAETITCTATAVTIQYTVHSPFPFRSLATYAADAVASSDGKAASVTYPLPVQPAETTSLGPFPDYKAIRDTILRVAEAVQASKIDLPPPVQIKTLPGQEKVIPPLFVTGGMTMMTKAPHSLWADKVRGTGVALTSITFHPKILAWEIKGDIYAAYQ